MVYTNVGVIIMNTAKLFKNGQSQAVRLPEDCRFTGSEVHIKKIGRKGYYNENQR
jgi:hypothetical protein